MWTGYVVYLSMALGYFLALKFVKKIPSISYGLFVLLLLILFPAYGLLLDLLVVGKYKVLESKSYVFTYPIIIANHLNALLFGFGISILLSTRIQNYGIKQWLKFLLYIPPVSVLTIFMRLPKGVQPELMLTRVNASIFVICVFAMQYLTYLTSQKAWEVEGNYLTSERAAYAATIVNQIKKMEDIPYPYAKGFFWVTQLSASDGTISFVLVENKKGSADWDDYKFLNWLSDELCFQQGVANQNRRGFLNVNIEFIVKDFEGETRWNKRTTYDSCDEVNTIERA
jgi:hypothetical protein